MNSKKPLPLDSQTARRLLKYLLIFYIVFCFVVAGLNFGLAKRASPEVAHAIHKLYEFFENELKTLLIILCSFLSLKAYRNSAGRRLYRGSLLMFTCSALVIHVILSLVSGSSCLLHLHEHIRFSLNPSLRAAGSVFRPLSP